MRIISGYLKGRTFDSTSNVTHPMSEKMRGAIFNMLGDIKGLTVLDIFSGSGAISFEAVSRGAKYVYAIESSKQAQVDIAKNIISLRLENKLKLIKANYFSWLSTSNDMFNIIIADPPYDKVKVERLIGLNISLESNGVIVLSLPPDSINPSILNCYIVSEKNYGDSKLVFYKNNL